MCRRARGVAALERACNWTSTKYRNIYRTGTRFCMIDKVVEMERFKRIVAIKSVTINEAFFQGHFPGKPVMPGVLILESMAQAGGLLLLQEIPDRDRSCCIWRQ